ARKRNQPFGLAVKPGKLDMRAFVGGCFEESARVQPQQAAIAALARGQEDEARPLAMNRTARAIIVLIAKIDRQRATDDRLNTGARHLLREFERAEHVAAIGERQSRLAVSFLE